MCCNHFHQIQLKMFYEVQIGQLWQTLQNVPVLLLNPNFGGLRDVFGISVLLECPMMPQFLLHHRWREIIFKDFLLHDGIHRILYMLQLSSDRGRKAARIIMKLLSCFTLGCFMLANGLGTLELLLLFYPFLLRHLLNGVTPSSCLCARSDITIDSFAFFCTELNLESVPSNSETISLRRDFWNDEFLFWLLNLKQKNVVLGFGTFGRPSRLSDFFYELLLTRGVHVLWFVELVSLLF